MSKAIATCNCSAAMEQEIDLKFSNDASVHLKQVNTIYSIEASREVCELCGCYPVYISHDKLTSQEDHSWRFEFSQDLNDILYYWRPGESDNWEDFGYGNRRKRNLAQEESA